MELNEQIDMVLTAQDVLEILALLNNGQFQLPGAAVERFSILKAKLNYLGQELQGEENKEGKKSKKSKENKEGKKSKKSKEGKEEKKTKKTKNKTRKTKDPQTTEK